MARDDDLAALALDEVRAIKARLDDQERVVGDLGETLNTIAEQIGAKSPDFLLSPWWFPSMTQRQAREAWDTLTKWVDELLIPTYDSPRSLAGDGRPADGEKIRPCWFAHPVERDKLAALHWAWRGSYKRNASAMAPIDWLDRVTKILDTIGLRMCASGCERLVDTELGRKKNTALTWADRAAWIQDDVAVRPAES